MSTKVKQVAILGGRGYVGSEIIKILNNHDHFHIAKVFSSSAAGTLVDIYSKDKSLKYEQLNINIDLSNIDFVILAQSNFWKDLRCPPVVPHRLPDNFWKFLPKQRNV